MFLLLDIEGFDVNEPLLAGLKFLESIMVNIDLPQSNIIPKHGDWEIHLV